MATVSVRGFHGRDAELALIQGGLERLAEGTETVVVVEGASGMGKSRLLAEVADIAHSLGVRTGSGAAKQKTSLISVASEDKGRKK